MMLQFPCSRDYILGLLPGEVFTHRNIGNIISSSDNSWPVALRYAVDKIKVSTLFSSKNKSSFVTYIQVTNMIICGHIRCGACNAKPYSTTPRIFPGIFRLEMQYDAGCINCSSSF
jgi:carbonic anhydrase